MKLHELRLQKAQHITKKGSDVAMVRDMVVLLQKVQKVDKAVPVIKERWRMRVGRCLFSVVYLNAGSIIHTVWNIKCFNLGQIDQLVEKYDIKEFSLENLYING